MEFPEYWPTFLTATNLNWLPLMQPDSNKQIIVDSLAFLVKDKRVKVYAFVIWTIIYTWYGKCCQALHPKPYREIF